MQTLEFAHPRFEDEVKKLLNNNVISSQNALFSNKLSDSEKYTLAAQKNRD
jgi:hypothetical protein